MRCDGEGVTSLLGKAIVCSAAGHTSQVTAMPPCPQVSTAAAARPHSAAATASTSGLGEKTPVGQPGSAARHHRFQHRRNGLPSQRQRPHAHGRAHQRRAVGHLRRPPEHPQKTPRRPRPRTLAMGQPSAALPNKPPKASPAMDGPPSATSCSPPESSCLWLSSGGGRSGLRQGGLSAARAPSSSTCRSWCRPVTRRRVPHRCNRCS
jgi:hypothetical protein